MLSKVDWLSFSLPVDTRDDATENDALLAAAAALSDLDASLPEHLDFVREWEPANGRAPYRTSWRSSIQGFTIFTHPALTHALVEISGAGCDHLIERGTLNEVLSIVAHRVTRLDIACDILTETRPGDFVRGRHEGRFKAHSRVVSESGETEYVGGRTSARYARVYRYNPPHERSHLLRVEYVVKQEDAKILARTIPSEGLAPLVASLGSSFGWQHPDWNPDAEPVELPVYRAERRAGKTLFWLADTIAPLMVRLHGEGVIDAERWFQENVVSKL